MKHRFLFFLVVFFCSSVYAQEYRWKVGLDYFFDNTENDYPQLFLKNLAGKSYK